MLKIVRPVSNLSFISKLIEKVVVSRLLDRMVENELLKPFSSAYRVGHSTETALLRVHKDIGIVVHPKKGGFLVLLDLSAALCKLCTQNSEVIFSAFIYRSFSHRYLVKRHTKLAAVPYLKHIHATYLYGRIFEWKCWSYMFVLIIRESLHKLIQM